MTHKTLKWHGLSGWVNNITTEDTTHFLITHAGFNPHPAVEEQTSVRRYRWHEDRFTWCGHLLVCRLVFCARGRDVGRVFSSHDPANSFLGHHLQLLQAEQLQLITGDTLG